MTSFKDYKHHLLITCLSVQSAEVREEYGKVLQRYKNVEDILGVMKQKLQHNSEIYRDILQGCRRDVEVSFHINTNDWYSVMIMTSLHDIIGWAVTVHPCSFLFRPQKTRLRGSLMTLALDALQAFTKGSTTLARRNLLRVCMHVSLSPRLSSSFLTASNKKLDESLFNCKR